MKCYSIIFSNIHLSQYKQIFISVMSNLFFGVAKIVAVSLSRWPFFQKMTKKPNHTDKNVKFVYLIIIEMINIHYFRLIYLNWAWIYKVRFFSNLATNSTLKILLRKWNADLVFASCEAGKSTFSSFKFKCVVISVKKYSLSFYATVDSDIIRIVGLCSD